MWIGDRFPNADGFTTTNLSPKSDELTGKTFYVKFFLLEELLMKQFATAVFPNLFGSRHFSLVLKMFAAPLAGLSSIKIKELYQWGAPLAPAHGTLVYHDTTVGNHCATVCNKANIVFLIAF